MTNRRRFLQFLGALTAAPLLPKLTEIVMPSGKVAGLVEIATDEEVHRGTNTDGAIQAFYQSSEPDRGMQVGDIWFDMQASPMKLYRFDGIFWIEVSN